MDIITATGIFKRFGEQQVLGGVSFRVREGSCAGFLGTNGSGKTTLLRVLLSLESLDAGTFTMLGTTFTTRRKGTRLPAPVAARIGYVSQQPAFDEHAPAWDNLAFHCKLHGLDKTSRRATIVNALETVRLLPHADKPVSQFSGGMKKRLDIARALLLSPALLVLDEPTANLDPRSRHHAWTVIEGVKARGVTVILATNDMAEARRLCDEVHFLDGGSIVESGYPGDLVGRLDATIVEVHLTADGIQGKASIVEAIEREGIPRAHIIDDAGKLVVHAPASRPVDGLVRLAPAHPALVSGVTARVPTLEDCFTRTLGVPVEWGNRASFRALQELFARLVKEG